MAERITFIGAGNMASAIFAGMIETGYPAEAITATASSEKTLTGLRDRYGIVTQLDNAIAVAEADIVVLSVKPQIMREVCETMRDAVQQRRPLIVSVAAGLEAATLDRWLGGDLAVVRCMPNTPSLVGAGAAGLYANPRVTQEQRTLATQLMSAVGLVEWVDQESLLDAVTAISGSGPAYFLLFFEALEQAGVELGLPREAARRLALQTGYGAAKMALESDAEPAELRRRVTSPKGTTERAIHSFQDADLEKIVADAARACAARAREMAVEYGGES